MPTLSPSRAPTRRRHSSRRRRVRVRRTVTVAVLAIAGLALVAALALGAMRVARSGALPGTHVGGLAVGGMEEAELASAVTGYAERRAGEEVRASLDDRTVTSTAADVGYRLDTDATVQAVLQRGRQANPVAALADHLRAFGDTIPVAAVEHVDDAELRAWTERTAGELAHPPVEGTLEFDGASITRVDPAPGTRVRMAALQVDGRTAARTEGAATVTVEAAEVDPDTTSEDVDAVLADAEQAVSAPVVLSRDDATATFDPDAIGNALVVAREGSALRLDVDAERMVEAIPPATLATWDRSPTDATFTVSGGSVALTPAQEGFRFDSDAAADQLLELATSEGDRTATLEGEVLEPDLTTEEAEALGIVEQVSTFTTHFTANQSRVTNIHRIADLVDGVVLEPGDTFSVNGHVGERTREKGFVGGGAIFDGEFVEQIGGGVSQFATTMYNAAYFGGYAIPAHQAHSYYISRYPVGREATLNYPSIDLKVRNNSPHGALIATSYTDTSVTVSVYGTRWVGVDSVAGERTDVTPPETVVRTTDDLPPGQERVVQSGREGFQITVTRVLTYPDGRVEREPKVTRYRPEPRIVERGAD